jgi:hypothetical protein
MKPIAVVARVMVVSVLAAVPGAAGTLPSAPGIWCDRQSSRALAPQHENRLLDSLRRITGLGLRFAPDGSLQADDAAPAESGAVTARQTLRDALTSSAVYLIEDHSGSAAVRFGQLDEGTHYEDGDRQVLVWRVRLDFRDFERLQAPPQVQASFDPGFVLLHELLHGLGHADPVRPGDVGAVEEILNRARVELGLPQRGGYFGSALLIANDLFTVRLPFRGATRTEYAAFLLDRRSLAAACAVRGEAAVRARR